LLLLSTAGLYCAPHPPSTPTASPPVSEDETPTEEGSLPQLSVNFIDVGQGDSILVDLGEIEVLIDGGNPSPGVTAYLTDYVQGNLEVIVATHTDMDHIGGLINVLDAFTVGNIWLNGYSATTNTYRDFMQKVNFEGAEIKIGRRGDTIVVGNLTFKVLNPIDPQFSDSNNNSLVLMLSYGTVDFLFMGDAQTEAESSMIAANVFKDIEILKVGHHGSHSSTSQAFLDIVRPEDAIYMAGDEYGHPHAETILALSAIGANIYGTDVNGTIVVSSDGDTYTIACTTSSAQPTPASTSTSTPTYSVSPTPEITPSPTPIATPTATQTLTLEIVSVTSPVSPGAYATLKAKTIPNALCDITVFYKSGPSTAQGLYTKYPDSSGSVSWTWKVGTSTTPGSWRIVVEASYGGKTVSQTTYFTAG